VPAQPLSKRATELPPMCTPATTMSTQDFLTNINIFTQFGDMTPSQMLTLFDQFHKWPEYTQQCPFVAAMETSFIKMEASADQNIDGIPDEDDVGESREKGDTRLK
jgi:dimethyladenosine transferase 2, mitochondrial